MLCSPGCSKEADTRGQSAPSVFIIVLDAASAQYFGCYGDTHGTSPNIDRFAAESVLFENAYGQTPTTVTSTASLMTGVRATTHLMTDTTVLDPKFETMPQAFSRQGMTCYGVIGNPFAGAPATGLDRGYAEAVQVYALDSLKTKRRMEESSKFIVTLPEDIAGETYKLLPK
ncbi:MAG: sulfatase-like hydrolase/transferase [Planctomycetes bacterium]|nr:sulfatase-like hydrolase/transferase [Planctomycetota bacterium]